eukprot:TRINITY_DN37909_c0_g1_i1.p1 TRINITY_DN37909_c0_g1~~TRINITY_DN37909_c0_g1_i1.p1  ORF type:complete len:507 (+),score=72.63 TRINITY_DN37909_c0_g1_i1:99-1619(+)
MKRRAEECPPEENTPKKRRLSSRAVTVKPKNMAVVDPYERMLGEFQLPGTLGTPCVADRKKLEFWLSVFRGACQDITIDDPPSEALRHVFSYNGVPFRGTDHLLKYMHRKQVILTRDEFLTPLISLRQYRESTTLLNQGLAALGGLERAVTKGLSLVGSIAWGTWAIGSQVLRRKRVHANIHLVPAEKLKGEYVNEGMVRAVAARVMNGIRSHLEGKVGSCSAVFNKLITPEELRDIVFNCGVASTHDLEPILCHLHTANKLQLLPLDDGSWGVKVETLTTPKTPAEQKSYIEDGVSLVKLLRVCDQANYSIAVLNEKLKNATKHPKFKTDIDLQKRAVLHFRKKKETMQMLENVERIMDSIDQAALTGSITMALHAGMEKLTKARDEVGGIEGVEYLMSETESITAEHNEINSRLAEDRVQAVSEEELRDELQQMQSDMGDPLPTPVPQSTARKSSISKTTFTPGKGFVTTPVKPPTLPTKTPQRTPEQIEREELESELEMLSAA